MTTRDDVKTYLVVGTPLWGALTSLWILRSDGYGILVAVLLSAVAGAVVLHELEQRWPGLITDALDAGGDAR